MPPDASSEPPASSPEARRHGPRLAAVAASVSVAIVVAATALVFGPRRSQQGRTYEFGTPCAERLDERPPPRRLPNAPGYGWLAWSGGDVLAAEPGTDLTPVRSDTCHLVVSVTRGVAWVEARDLGGGDVLLTTRHGEVHAEGAPPSSEPTSSGETPIRFAVTVRDDTLRVAVATGRVTLRRKGSPPLSLGARESTQLRAGGFHVEHANEAELGPLRLAFLKNPVPRPQAPAPKNGEPSSGSPLGDPLADPHLVREPVGASALNPALALPTNLPTASPPPEAPPPEQLADLLLDAEQAEQQGRREAAARILERVALGKGPVADAAALRLVRMQLDEGRFAEAASSLGERRRRLSGPLAAEAAWLGVTLEQRQGHATAARKQAAELVRRWPTSPQATAARALLGNQAADQP